MQNKIVDNLLSITANLDVTDKILIKNESLKKNFFYSIHCINKFAELSLQDVLKNNKFEHLNDPSFLGRSIVNSYIQNLKDSLMVTLGHEFNILVEDGMIENNLPDFIATITNDTEWLEYFFDKYPSVVELLIKTISNSISFTLKFLNNYNLDVDEISSVFNVKQDDLVTLEMSISDNHNNQSGVIKLLFSSRSVFYKPRNLQPEQEIYQFFDFLQSLGIKKSIYVPKIVSGIDYGWMEGVSFEPAATEEELLEFYYNQGLNLALFYFMGVADLIGDNILACRTLPCYFDLECIMQPDISDIDLDLFEISSKAARFIRTSVLRTNLLPQYSFTTHEYQGLSISGLSYVKGTLPEMKMEHIEGQFKRYYENSDFSYQNYHIPIKNIEPDSEIYVPHIIKGFIEAYTMVVGHRKEIRQYIINHFENIKIRILYRPTHVYSKLLTESYLPYYLSDPINRDRLFSSLKNLESAYLRNSKIIASEITQLDNQDIPIFYGQTQSASISSNQNIIYKDFFNTSGMDAVLDRIAFASDEDMKAQVQLIRLSFSIHHGFPIKNNVYVGRNYGLDDIKTNTNRDEIITLIRNQILILFDKIQEKTFRDDQDFSSWSLFQTPSYTWDISALRWGIFDGLDGLSFFYLNLYNVFGNEAAIEIGKRYLEKGLQQFEEYKELYADRTGFNKISLFNYPVSTFYIAEYYMQSGIPINLSDKMIHRLLDWIEENYLNDEDYDLLSGGAGTIIYLLKLYDRLLSNKILDLAKRIAHHIVKGAVHIDEDKICWLTKFGKAHTGLSHGSSGIAFAFFKLGYYLKNNVFEKEAIKALNYERLMFDKDDKFWYSFKLMPEGTIVKVQNHFWAYGSGGILSGRLLISDYYQDNTIDDEIELAKENILIKGYMTNFNYSSGLFGNLDVLNEYANFKSDHFIKTKLFSIIETIIKEKTEFDEWSCVPFGKNNSSSIEMIGLFTGISGIGNTLINMIDSDNLAVKLFN